MNPSALFALTAAIDGITMFNLSPIALFLIVIGVLVLLGVLAIGGLLVFLHFRRQNLLRHKERMDMIQHGIDPDYVPVDVDPALKETTDHGAR